MDAGLLCDEANRALVDLLATKSSIEAHQQTLVWELSVGLCQNESKTTKSIKTPKATYYKAVREAKTLCAHFIQEAKTLCSMAIRNAEAWEPPRLAHFRNHMPSPSCIWKSKPWRRRTEVSLTSSLPVKLLYKPALWNSIVH